MRTRHFLDPATDQVFGYDEYNADLIQKAIENKYIELDNVEAFMEARHKKAYEEAIANLSYDEKRRAEYPPITDYLDGIVNGDQNQVQRYIDACRAVKAKYPKG